jgi:hypothetical protein
MAFAPLASVTHADFIGLIDERKLVEVEHALDNR